METWAVHNFKGGVGKTTTVVNLGAGLAMRGARVVVVDADRQASLSRALRRKGREPAIYDVLLSGARPALYPTVIDGLSVLPGSSAIDSLDYDILRDTIGHGGHDGTTDVVKHLGAYLAPRLRALAGTFSAAGIDYAIWDLPSQASILVTLSVIMCDRLIVPVQCEVLSVDVLDQVQELLDELPEGQGAKARILRTMYPLGHKHQATQSRAVEESGIPVVSTAIKRQTLVNDAAEHGVPAIALYPGSDVARGYNMVLDELVGPRVDSQDTGTESREADHG